MARKRKDWIRIRDEDGNHSWQHRPSTKPHHISAHACGTNKHDEEERHSVGFVARLAELTDENSPPEDQGQNHEGYPQVQDTHRLTLVECSTSLGITTLRGYEIPKADLLILDAVTTWTFHEKYKWFLEETHRLIQPWEDQRLKITVSRTNVLLESMEQLLGIDVAYLHMPIRVDFVGESGVDAGGLEREWVALLSQIIFHNDTGLFQTFNRELGTYGICPDSETSSNDYLLYFRGVGRFIGRVLLTGHILNARLCQPLIKHILGTPISFSDLEFFDPELYRHMLWLRENSGVESLCLDFTLIKMNSSGCSDIIELKPGGASIVVTDQNKEEYIQLRLKYVLLGSIAPQLQSLLTGVFEIVPQELLMVFDYQELDLLLSGIPELDLEDWKAHTVVDPTLAGHRDLVTWFWEILDENMNNYERSQLLQYITGTGHVPAQGFQALTSYDGRIRPFTLNGVAYSDMAYPKAHTCFNRLDLPFYQSKTELRRTLKYIVQMDCTGFTVE